MTLSPESSPDAPSVGVSPPGVPRGHHPQLRLAAREVEEEGKRILEEIIAKEEVETKQEGKQQQKEEQVN